MKKILIVGQGIAGTCLARTCALKGLDFLVIDRNHHNASSMVAAGMWNPIVFRNLTKSWNIDTLLPFAESFYRNLETELGETYLSHYRIARLFPAQMDQNDWEIKSETPGFDAYMSSGNLPDVEAAPLIKPFGYGVVEKTGRLNLPGILRRYARHLTEQGKLKSEDLDYQELNVNGKVNYRNEEFDAVVFCEGSAIRKNPWFHWLPVQPNKGEVFTIKAPDLKLENLVNRGLFILSLGEDLYRVGATFGTKNISLEKTEKARDWVVNKLSGMITCSYEIVDHQVGLRPTVPDRKPILGRHPEIAQMYVLNGMGAKGVTTAPLMADHLLNYLLNEMPIPATVNIQRFYPYYAR